MLSLRLYVPTWRRECSLRYKLTQGGLEVWLLSRCLGLDRRVARLPNLATYPRPRAHALPTPCSRGAVEAQD